MSWLTTVFTDFQIGLMAFPLLLVLVALRLPLAASMFIVGILGSLIVDGNKKETRRK
mgnify:CR=1 FL=1